MYYPFFLTKDNLKRVKTDALKHEKRFGMPIKHMTYILNMQIIATSL